MGNRTYRAIWVTASCFARAELSMKIGYWKLNTLEVYPHLIFINYWYNNCSSINATSI